MSLFGELAFVIMLLAFLDWQTLRDSSKRDRYVYMTLVFSAGIIWVYLSLVNEVPRLGNVLEKLVI